MYWNRWQNPVRCPRQPNFTPFGCPQQPNINQFWCPQQKSVKLHSYGCLGHQNWVKFGCLGHWNGVKFQYCNGATIPVLITGKEKKTISILVHTFLLWEGKNLEFTLAIPTLMYSWWRLKLVCYGLFCQPIVNFWRQPVHNTTHSFQPSTMAPKNPFYS